MPGISGVQWDVFDRMTQATANGTTTQYTYDAMGRRMARVGPSGTDTFFYDMGGRLLATYAWTNPSQPQLTRYLAGQKLGQYTDRVGSVRYGNTGGVVNHYYPYGELVAGTNNTGFKFAETYRDDSGLDYALNRYYNSAIGRFLSVDPYGGSARPRLPQSWNRYAYVRNDPLNAVDPTGLFTQKKPGSAFKSGSLDCYFDNAGYACQWAYMDGGGEIYDGPMVEEYLPDEGGGGPDPLISSTVQSALDGLRNRDKCAQLFKIDAGKLLTSINSGDVNNGDLGRITYGDLGGRQPDGGIVVAKSEELDVYRTVNGQTVKQITALITINTQGPFVNGYSDNLNIGGDTAKRNAIYRAITIIHELNHSAAGIYGFDAITMPLERNEQTIYDACFK